MIVWEHKVTGILCKDAGEWEAEIAESGRRSGISEEDIGKCLFENAKKIMQHSERDYVWQNCMKK